MDTDNDMTPESELSANEPGRRLTPELSVLRRRTRARIDWIDVDGVVVRYAIRRGRGRVMLLLNTIGANLDMLLRLVDALDDVEVIVPDMPGAGGSPALFLPHRTGWHARLIAKLLDRLGYDAAINVVGMGWGGSVGQQFALDYPARVNRLVLASSSVVWPCLASRSNMLKRLLAVRHARRAESLTSRLSSRYGGLVRRRPDLADRRGEYADGGSIRGYINQLAGATGWTRIYRLHGLACPTLIMGGDDDPVVPLVNGRVLYWLIPNSCLHVVRGGGHLFLLMRANESAAVIRRFINERRYDGTDDADQLTAGGLGASTRLTPRLLSSL